MYLINKVDDRYEDMAYIAVDLTNMDLLKLTTSPAQAILYDEPTIYEVVYAINKVSVYNADEESELCKYDFAICNRPMLDMLSVHIPSIYPYAKLESHMGAARLHLYPNMQIAISAHLFTPYASEQYITDTIDLRRLIKAVRQLKDDGFEKEEAAWINKVDLAKEI